MRAFLIDSISHLDLVVWLLVITFFCGSALLFGGNVQLAFIGAGGVIVEMLLIGLAIEIIIESLKNIRGLGTVTGFITNGPEALCLVVGLVVGDILFAASTPLGSNFMNPILLFIAALITSRLGKTASQAPYYTLITLTITTLLVVTFYTNDETSYPTWVIAAFVLTVPLFIKRPRENQCEEQEEHLFNPSAWLPAAIIIMLTTGYFLDPVVSFAATHSHAPKGVIGFIVLSTLTSWPEFKSCLALLSRNKPLAAILNITVSNITNIWLAAGGVLVYLVTR
ncbi:MAG: sodium:proton exchanger [Thermodesulfobacteriota bacterium]